MPGTLVVLHERLCSRMHVLFVFKSGNFLRRKRQCCCCNHKMVRFGGFVFCTTFVAVPSLEQHSILFCMLLCIVKLCSILVLLFVACYLALGCSLCALWHATKKAPPWI